MLAALAAGCGLMGRNAEPTPLPPVEVELVSFDAAGSWNEAEQALIEQFQEAQPNVSFGRGSYAQSPSAYLSASPPPDLMVISPGYLLDQAAAQEQLVELTDLWQQSGLAEDYPASFQALSTRGGRQYYMPVAYTWTALYFNEEIFAEFGLEPPTTWDEFIAVCETLLAGGVTPLSIAGNDIFLNTLWFDYLNLRLNGLDFHQQLMNGEASFQDERVRSVLEVWGSLLERGYFVEKPERMGALDSMMAVVSTPAGLALEQKAAMTLTGPSYLGSIPAALRGELDFFAFPSIDPSIPTAEALTAYGYMIPQDAANRDAALSFVSFAGAADAQTQMVPRLNVSDAGLAPANPQAETDNLPDSVRRGAAIVTEADGVTPFFVLAAPDAMWDRVDRAIGYFLQNPWDVETTMVMLEEARQAALAAGAFLDAD